MNQAPTHWASKRWLTRRDTPNRCWVDGCALRVVGVAAVVVIGAGACAPHAETGSEAEVEARLAAFAAEQERLEGARQRDEMERMGPSLLKHYRERRSR